MFDGRHRVDLRSYRLRGVGLEVDRVVPGLRFRESVGFFLGEDSGVPVVLGRNHILKLSRAFGLIGFGSDISGVGVAGEAPELV